MSQTDSFTLSNTPESKSLPPPDLKLEPLRPIDECDTKIVLLTDRPLSRSQLDLLYKYYSVLELEEHQTSKAIYRLPAVEIYIIPLINNIVTPINSWGMLYYAKYVDWLKTHGYQVTYYRTMGLITKPEQLNYDFLITDYPANVISKQNLKEQLQYQAMPYHIGFFGVLSACLCSRITCGDFCGLVTGALFL
jgi:hypothetical protein